MSRTVRRLIGLVAALGLLSAQLSLAAYACPRVGPEGSPAATSSVHADCAEHRSAPSQAPLCEAHCQASLSVPSSPAQDIVVPATVLRGRATPAASLVAFGFRAPPRARGDGHRSTGHDPVLPLPHLIPAYA